MKSYPNNFGTRVFSMPLPQGGTLRIGERTLIMGIINVTPDSFSDGGRFLDRGKAVAHGVRLAEEGADILDVGGESTRPGAQQVPLEIEVERVVPVVKELSKRVTIPISIDTYKAEVAARALDAGASIVNDISALRFDSGMARVVAERKAPVIMMHIAGTPRDMQDNPQYEDVVLEIKSCLREAIERACEAGIRRDMTIIDPGIGFGKTVEHNLEILARLVEFKELGRPVLIGLSRKSLIGKVLGLPVEERLEGSIALAVYSVMCGVHILRVHDVKETVRAVRMVEAVLAVAKGSGFRSG